jgi:cytidyltransferase-like protein
VNRDDETRNFKVLESFPISAVPLEGCTLVDGSFDPIHDGHIDYFDQAKKLGKPVACLVAPERYTETKHPTLLPVSVRARVLLSLTQIDFVVISDFPTHESIKRIKPGIFFKGEDWADKLPPEIVGVCAELGIQMLFGKTPLNSSTRILENFLEEYKRRLK